MPKAIFNWSGGKDSALALHKALHTPELEIVGLLTTQNAENKRVSMHGVPIELVQAQADAIGLPLHILSLTPSASMENYNVLMRETWQKFAQEGITHAVFGDIFLEDLRQYREQKLAEVGISAVFPIWGLPTETILTEFWELGFEALTVCVSDKKLGRDFVGKVLSADFIKSLPAEVDICGENGEYHSFVYKAPYFQKRIEFTILEPVLKTFPSHEGAWDNAFWYADLRPLPA